MLCCTLRLAELVQDFQDRAARVKFGQLEVMTCLDSSKYPVSIRGCQNLEDLVGL